MATANPKGMLSRSAGAAIGINRVVKVGAAAGEVIAATAIAELAMGVAQEAAAAAGDMVSIATSGSVKCVASTAIALHAEVMVTASGAGKVSTAAGATARSIGVALEAALVDGDTITVLLTGLPAVAGPANT